MSSGAESVALYTQMLRIRLFEERVKEESARDRIKGMLHLYIGEEAVAVGVCSALRRDDYITSTHRGHGHFIARGADLRRMMAELYGKADGYCGGKGGSMHIADFALGHLGANGIVGGGLPIATGAAIAIQLNRETGRVVVCFFGDGALAKGEFHESLNLAGLWNLPVVYVCENNQYALSTPVRKSCAVGQDAARRAEAYGMPGITADGMDVLAVRRAVEPAIRRARDGSGPSLVVCTTYRFLGHGRNPETRSYRSKDEEATWREKCPIKSFEEKLRSEGLLSDEIITAVRGEILDEVEEAVRFAEQSPFPSTATIEEDLHA
jgi:TPP-dependent pyruvate/acetoin dehydrogenase alpha subunit